MNKILLPELWKNIFEFDPTYHEHFKYVLEEINLLMTKKLADNYFDGSSQHWPKHFRFFQNNVWYTADYIEQSYNLYHVVLYNEKYGTYAKHLHHVAHHGFKKD
jgi:hypothetical protein